MNKILAAALSLALLVVAAAVPVSAGPRFPDIVGHWCEAEVSKAQDLGFVDGYPDGTMKPDEKVTRAEFVKMVVAAYRFAILKNPRAYFADVSSHWCLPYLDAAVGNGVVEVGEYGSGNYEPDRYITRDEASAYLTRALGLKNRARMQDPKTAPFSDMYKVNGFYAGDVTLCSYLGILKGYEDGTVRGNTTLSRAEGVVMVLRSLSCKGVDTSASIAPLKAPWSASYWMRGSTIMSYEDGTQENYSVDAPAKIEDKVSKSYPEGYVYLYWERGQVPYGSGGLHGINRDLIYFMMHDVYKDYENSIPLMLMGAIMQQGPVEFNEQETSFEMRDIELGHLYGTRKGSYWVIDQGRYLLCRQFSGKWTAGDITNWDTDHEGDITVTALYDPTTGLPEKLDLTFHGHYLTKKGHLSMTMYLQGTRSKEDLTIPD